MEDHEADRDVHIEKPASHEVVDECFMVARASVPEIIVGTMVGDDGNDDFQDESMFDVYGKNAFVHVPMDDADEQDDDACGPIVVQAIHMAAARSTHAAPPGTKHRACKKTGWEDGNDMTHGRWEKFWPLCIGVGTRRVTIWTFLSSF